MLLATLARIAIVGLVPTVAFAQAVPDSFPVGEFEIGLTVVGFGREDIVSIKTFPLDHLHAVQVDLSPRLDGAFAAATRGKIGYQATLRVCGRHVFTARLSAELATAEVLFTSGEAQTAAAAVDLIRDPPCADL